MRAGAIFWRKDWNLPLQAHGFGHHSGHPPCHWKEVWRDSRQQGERHREEGSESGRWEDGREDWREKLRQRRWICFKYTKRNVSLAPLPWEERGSEVPTWHTDQATTRLRLNRLRFAVQNCNLILDWYNAYLRVDYTFEATADGANIAAPPAPPLSMAFSPWSMNSRWSPASGHCTTHRGSTMSCLWRSFLSFQTTTPGARPRTSSGTSTPMPQTSRTRLTLVWMQELQPGVHFHIMKWFPWTASHFSRA